MSTGADKETRITVAIRDPELKALMELVPRSHRGQFAEQALRLYLASGEGASVFNFLRLDGQKGIVVAAAAVAAPTPLAAPVVPAPQKPLDQPVSGGGRVRQVGKFEAPAVVATEDAVDDIMGAFND